jgi:arginyl-tRNA synthetase
MDMKARIAALIETGLSAAWPGMENLPGMEEIAGFLEIPPEREMGDYAFPCFRLAKVLRAAPPVIASRLQAAIDAPNVARLNCVGGYLNFFLNRENFAKETLQTVISAGEKWGASQEGAGKTICLDYSSINIAKRFHIGHLSTTMIGHSLKRIFDFLGYTTVGINHLGDWGTQWQNDCRLQELGNGKGNQGGRRSGTGGPVCALS